MPTSVKNSVKNYAIPLTPQIMPSALALVCIALSAYFDVDCGWDGQQCSREGSDYCLTECPRGLLE